MAADQGNSGAIADPLKVIWIRPAAIRFKLSGTKAFQMGLTGVEPGDWDLRRGEIEGSAKYRSIVQHFVEGADWTDTILFARYAQRLERGESVRGCGNIADLKRDYDARITKLFEGMKTDGFRIAKGRPEMLPYVYMARDGEILFGRAGNHRFAMARILNMEFIPCIVRARHESWQQIRDAAFDHGLQEAERLAGRDLADHPDLADVIPVVRESLWRNFRTRVREQLINTARKWRRRAGTIN